MPKLPDKLVGFEKVVAAAVRRLAAFNGQPPNQVITTLSQEILAVNPDGDVWDSMVANMALAAFLLWGFIQSGGTQEQVLDDVGVVLAMTRIKISVKEITKRSIN